MSVVRQDTALVRRTVIGISLGFLLLFLGAPIAIIFFEALRHGIPAYLQAVSDPMTISALKLSLIVVAVVIPLNTVFGIAAAWAVTKFDFSGKRILIALIDLPFSVSPVISGLIFVLLFGAQGMFGAWLREHEIRIIFALPGIIISTVFITFPFVARELIPLMQVRGNDQEEAALALGANGWQTFWHVTLPGIKWGVVYGVILLAARAMGEFGAVSVVSGHIRGQTNTLPLHVEILYNEYNFTGAFAVSSLLALFSIVTLLVKTLIAWHAERIAVEEGSV